VAQGAADAVDRDLEDLGRRPTATLDMRTDPQNLPAGLTKDKWPGKDFGTFGGGDFSGAFSERAESLWTPSATTNCRGSSPSRATATASGPAMPPPKLPPAGSTRSG